MHIMHVFKSISDVSNFIGGATKIWPNFDRVGGMKHESIHPTYGFWAVLCLIDFKIFNTIFLHKFIYIYIFMKGPLLYRGVIGACDVRVAQ